jgi:hypothetical protein
MAEIIVSPHHAHQIIELSEQNEEVIGQWAKWMEKYYSNEVIAEILKDVESRRRGAKILFGEIGKTDHICEVCLQTVNNPQCGNRYGGSEDKDTQILLRNKWRNDQVV